MKDKMKRLAENILKSEQGLVGAARAANPIRNLPGIIKVEIAKKNKIIGRENESKNNVLSSGTFLLFFIFFPYLKNTNSIAVNKTGKRSIN